MASDMSLVPSAIAVLAASPSVFRALLSPLPAALISAPGPEGWCARDVLAHVVARQRPAMIDRINAMLADDGAAIPDIPDNATEVETYREMPLAAVLDAYDALRAEALTIVRPLSAEQLSRRGVHSVAGAISVADVIHHHAYHDLLHIEQAASLIDAPLEERRGAMRIF